MKHVIILGDGMADEPCASLKISLLWRRLSRPHLTNWPFAADAECFQRATPDSVPREVSHLSLFGYDVASVFEGRECLRLRGGSGSHARRHGDAPQSDKRIPGGIIKSHTAGRISSEEAGELIDSLNSSLADGMVEFHKGSDTGIFSKSGVATSGLYVRPHMMWSGAGSQM